eukprot:29022-Eustigmatos_ZCMA.PRE.1
MFLPSASPAYRSVAPPLRYECPENRDGSRPARRRRSLDHVRNRVFGVGCALVGEEEAVGVDAPCWVPCGHALDVGVE